MSILLILLAAVVLVSVAASAMRSVASQVEKQRNKSIDQEMVEARLYRIEEAIDAMSQQIQRLTEHQVARLGGEVQADRLPDDTSRTERPR